jgi:hypothetical protein
MQDLIRYFPINVLMLRRDDIIRVWDVNVCADELCACILAELADECFCFSNSPQKMDFAQENGIRPSLSS